ncbi:helix-turn-helix domain-containing protein [Proteus columbae]|uniref:helix-turn-helix domain-containing protein n=1 Tax=Proteus columbae TaxID=1987580 RepID=UPI0012FFD481|nr:AraC family transcriptional regulator [Proteus columbae]
MHHLDMDNAFLALTTQLFQTSVLEPLKPLYYSGKACEFASLSLQYLYRLKEPIHRSLSQREKNSLNQAKAILMAEMDTPPKLEILASRVGLNTRKLTLGFRQLFGDSVYGWLQEYRLQTTYNMLLNQDISVSSVAYSIGYTPAHFSVAFRKRFSLLPGDVRRASVRA